MFSARVTAIGFLPARQHLFLSGFAGAFRYLEEGHAHGKVVITVEPTASALELSATKITSTLPAIAV
jgi:hypothetical protein